MKYRLRALAVVIGSLICAFAAAGIIVPSVLVWIAERSVTPGVYYVIAVVRVAVGLVLISVASASRAPKTLRVLGGVILVAGIATAVTGLAAIERGRAFVDWWLRQGSGMARLTCILLLAVGGFVAYACAPSRRAV